MEWRASETAKGKETKWMSADNRHYSAAAGVFVRTESAVRAIRSTPIFRGHTNTEHGSSVE